MCIASTVAWSRITSSLVVVCYWVLLLSASPVIAQTVTDGSFETPDIATGSAKFNPTGSPWTFVGFSGIIDSPGGGYSAPTPPSGAQVGFLNFFGTTACGFSEPITLTLTGTYRLSFMDAGRPGSGNLPYEVLLDSTIIFNRTTSSGQAFTAQSADFSAAAGTHTLTFQTSAGATSDNTAFFDVVAVNSVPEPSITVLLAGSLIAVAASRPRRMHAGVRDR